MKTIGFVVFVGLFASLCSQISVAGEIEPCRDGYCPLNDKLIAVNSSGGYRMLADGKSYAFFQLMNSFETQNTPMTCGVATIVTILNSMHVPKPETICFMGQCARYFTQDYLLNNNTCSKQIIGNPMQGLDLHQVAEIFNCFSLKSQIFYSNVTSFAEYKELFKNTYKPGVFMAVNYRRGEVHQFPSFGVHLSPLAAYNEKADRVLILDVARYIYPPVWVKSADMISAMNTTTNTGLPRGLLLVHGPNYSDAIEMPKSSSVAFFTPLPMLIIIIAFTVLRMF